MICVVTIWQDIKLSAFTVCNSEELLDELFFI